MPPQSLAGCPRPHPVSGPHLVKLDNMARSDQHIRQGLPFDLPFSTTSGLLPSVVVVVVAVAAAVAVVDAAVVVVVVDAA